MILGFRVEREGGKQIANLLTQPNFEIGVGCFYFSQHKNHITDFQLSELSSSLLATLHGDGHLF